MSEVLKSLWGKLYAWALPSAFALAATWLLLLRETNFLTLGNGPDGGRENFGLVFLALTGALAISLSSGSTQLYRILEGYLWPQWLQVWGERRQLARKKALQLQVAGGGWRRAIALEKLARYPLDDTQIVPTRFGNAIRSFETYGRTRFNLDSQRLWFELVAVAPKYIQSEIDFAQSSVDFFVALFYLSIAFGCLCCFLVAIKYLALSVVLLCLPAFALAILCHWLAIRAIDAWSYPVHALVNLGRVKLADDLGLRLPETIEEEKIMWGLVADYAKTASRECGKALDAYRKLPEELRGSDDRSEQLRNTENEVQ